MTSLQSSNVSACDLFRVLQHFSKKVQVRTGHKHQVESASAPGTKLSWGGRSTHVSVPKLNSANIPWNNNPELQLTQQTISSPYHWAGYIPDKVRRGEQRLRTQKITLGVLYFSVRLSVTCKVKLRIPTAWGFL